MIMPSVPDKDSMPDRGVLRSLLSALAFENRMRLKGNSPAKKMTVMRRRKRRDCFGRPCVEPEEETVAENDSTDQNFYEQGALVAVSMGEDQQPQYILDPSFVDIFYDAKDKFIHEAYEELVGIGLEPDDSVMQESIEASLKDYSFPSDTSSYRHYESPLEGDDTVSLGAPSCSSLSVSEAPTRASAAETKPARTDITQASTEPKPELPVRFLRAGKGDEVEGWRRYEATLQWRKDNEIDTCLYKAWPNFELIKKHYPHYFHCLGRNGEPVFFEQPPKTDLRSLRNGGVGVEMLLQHYAMVTEFQWQYVSREDHGKSIYIIDLAGIRMTDFMGECVDFVRQASEFTGQNYPERAGYVFVINVPGWFKIIWNVVKPMVDEVTLEKIYILKGKEEIFNALLERIPIENIPQEYGGQSCYKLGESPEEDLLSELIQHNNDMAEGKPCCHGGKTANPPCRFCSFDYARHY